jgi:hypothetical protein
VPVKEEPLYLLARAFSTGGLIFEKVSDNRRRSRYIDLALTSAGLAIYLVQGIQTVLPISQASNLHNHFWKTV